MSRNSDLPTLTAAVPDKRTVQSSPRRSFSWRAKALCLVASAFLGWAVVEAGLRLVDLDEPRVWVPDPVLGWRHLPGARCLWRTEGVAEVQINALGYRDRERTKAKPPGAFRVAVLGDSMTEGAQVKLEETFTYLAEERLRQSGMQVEVLNFGVNGYSTAQELLLLPEVLSYSPDFVVLAVFLDNDVAGCHPRLSGSVSSPYPVVDGDRLGFDYSQAEQSHRHYHLQPVYTVRKYSGLYRRLRAKPLLEWGGVRANTPSLEIPLRFRLYQEPHTAEWEDAWLRFEAVLREFSRSLSDKNVAWAIMSVPAGQVVNDKSWQAILKNHPVMADSKWDVLEPEQRLAAFAKDEQILHLQPNVEFQQAAKQAPLFFGDVGHFTAEGHAVMAGSLVKFLKDHAAGLIQ